MKEATSKKPLPFKAEFGFKTTPERSANMKKIKSSNTKAEVLFRKMIWAVGIRYRMNLKSLPGKPDVVLTKLKIAIFIDGEFWHGKNWHETKNRIKSNRDYWIPKIERNMARDLENNSNLKKLGYKVVRIWARDLLKDPKTHLETLLLFIKK